MFRTIKKYANSNRVRLVYLYAVSIVSLFMIVFSTSKLINIFLKSRIFPAASTFQLYPNRVQAPALPPDKTLDAEVLKQLEAQQQVALEEEKKYLADQQLRQKAQELSDNISILLVSIPVFLLHYAGARKEGRRAGDEEPEDKRDPIV